MDQLVARASSQKIGRSFSAANNVEYPDAGKTAAGSLPKRPAIAWRRAAMIASLVIAAIVALHTPPPLAGTAPEQVVVGFFHDDWIKNCRTRADRFGGFHVNGAECHWQAFTGGPW